MSETCCDKTQVEETTTSVPGQEAICPTNQQLGKKIDAVTLKALLALPLNELRPIDYRFCRASNCPTVYYSVDGTQVFQETDLREKVYQKHPQDDDILVCYCFQYTIKDVKLEVERTGNNIIVEQINRGVQAGLCACDIRNPQGSCCLGNILQIVRSMKNKKE